MQKLMLKVDGMHCGGCSARLQRVVEALPQVESCVANHETKNVEITLKGELPLEILSKAIEGAGFTVISAE